MVTKGRLLRAVWAWPTRTRPATSTSTSASCVASWSPLTPRFGTSSPPSRGSATTSVNWGRPARP
jgi:hypothetical protein